MRRPNHYHKGYSPAEQAEARRESKRRGRTTRRDTDVRTKKVIVWDGEGMKLTGPDKPQHYVLFGCSVRPDNPLVIDKPDGRLTFEQLADYCIDVASEYPNAIHLGYFFQYDQNMIIWSLPWPAKLALYHRGACRVTRNGKRYIVRCVFGKTIRITRIVDDVKVSILIEDIAAFFATSFVVAYKSLFPTIRNPENWAIVEEGKKQRADMLYEDMPKVRRYWRAEILALEELAIEFRRLMFEGGFMLTQWYGPGALANYIRKRHGLARHEWGGKEDNMPPPVHEAVKGAFYGGHIEQYQVGRIDGPIYQYDKNSAYPSAFCHVPTLAEGGEWRYVGPVTAEEWFSPAGKRLRIGFAVFRVRWYGESSHRESSHRNTLIQPLPHRSQRDSISYPRNTEGWYWAPEVGVAMDWARRRAHKGVKCEIFDGWIWEPKQPVEWPWEDLMIDLYTTRRVLKDADNPVQMGYKLSMNSLYGKAAQRAGGKDKPPSSHTLPIAGYVTSECRAAVMKLMLSCKPGTVLNVETDGVFTTTPPDELEGNFPISAKLGDWDVKVLDEMIVIQNGVYLKRIGDAWKPPKSRGIPAAAVNRERILEHFKQCINVVRWPTLKFTNKESFLTIGSAIARATRINRWGRRSTNPYKASALHCTWKADPREIDIEGHNSKRHHVIKICPECAAGRSPAETGHPLTINSAADWWSARPTDQISHSYSLPWEKEHKEELWRLEKEVGSGVFGDGTDEY